VAAPLYVIGFVTLIYVIRRWKGNATNQLILSLAKKIDEAKDDA